MSYQVIARKWRPQSFEEVTGQEHITQTLRNAIEHDRLHHAYLFSGARGVGKTTTARLLAKAVNCNRAEGPTPNPCAADDPNACPSCVEVSQSRSIDVLEFDAASHTKVEEIRDIILEGINISPARDRFKVFIIDEVHQLSGHSFNALLKTLEEPPPNVVFIMATTELQKVPETIRSRCQEFLFRTIARQKIYDRLKMIADAESIEIEDDALNEIARSGEGSMRDAQSNFDQIISFTAGAITVRDVAASLGMAGTEMLTRSIKAIADRDPQPALEVVDELVARGQDLRTFCRDLMALIRDLTVVKVAGNGAALLESSAFDPEQLAQLAEPFSGSDLIRFFNSIAETESSLKDATNARLTLEIGLVKLIEMRRLAAVEDILERLTAIEGSPRAASTHHEKAAAAAVTPEKKTLKSADPAGSPEVTDSEALPPQNEEPRWESRSYHDEPADDEEPPLDAEPLPPAAAFIPADMPVAKLPPLSSEDLAHVDDKWLDAAYEIKLKLSGDDLMPIPNIDRLRMQLFGAEASAASVSHSGAAAVPARDVSRYMPDLAVEEDESGEIPVLPPSPGTDDLMAFAEAHPTVRRAMRIFRAEIVSVEQI